MVKEASSESARLGETSAAISPHEKEKEGEDAIAREDMHSRSEPVKGDMTY